MQASPVSSYMPQQLPCQQHSMSLLDRRDPLVAPSCQRGATSLQLSQICVNKIIVAGMRCWVLLHTQHMSAPAANKYSHHQKCSPSQQPKARLGSHFADTHSQSTRYMLPNMQAATCYSCRLFAGVGN
jgi:hypothetical protein